MPEIAEVQPRIELRTSNENDRVALRGVRLRARVAGMSLKATVEQTFVNLEARAIEAVYTFPLPERAAVCGFEVVFFDKVFTGVVDETDRAIERYDDAIADGHGAYLLERHRPDVFTVRVGNLKPRQAVTVRLTYVSDVEVVDRQVRLAFPTTIAPRYATTSGTDPIEAAIEADAMNPPHVLSVPYGLTMEVEVDLDRNLVGVGSPSHDITVSRDGAWHVTFAGGVAEMNRDVVLTLAMAREQEPFALAASGPSGERFVALNFVPEFDEEEGSVGVPPSKSETVFLLDCSGSMMGESLTQAITALECCLRSMSAGDAFNVLRFGSTYEQLSAEPLVYSQEALGAAVRFVRREEDLGGTELLAPLERVLAGRPGVGAVRNVVLLTDGQVTNEPAVIALAKRYRSRNRLFTFGIGTAASAFLVGGLARVTGGAAEFVAPGERIEEKVLRTFGRLASPPVTDVEVDWGNADVETAPRTLPPLFDGDALRVFARVPGRLPEVVTLKCNTAGGPRSWAVTVRVAEDPANVLPSLWARSMIRAIEEEEGIQQTASISAPSRERARLIDLSKRYNLLCGLTSFIAVEHRSLEDRDNGQPAMRRIPTQLALGWGEEVLGCEVMDEVSPAAFYCLDKTLDRTVVPAAAAPRRRGLLSKLRQAVGGKMVKGGLYDKQAAPVPPASGFYDGSGSFRDSIRDREAADRAAGGRLDDTCYGAPAPAPAQEPPKPPPPGDDLIHLLAHQAADGSFDDSATVEHVLRSTRVERRAVESAVDRLLHEAHVPSAVRPKVAHALLVVLVLRLAFAGRQPTWSRAAKKAVRFVTDAGQLHAGQAEQWLRELSTRFANAGVA